MVMKNNLARKIFTAAIALAMLSACRIVSASADRQSFGLEGTIVAGDTWVASAPFGGTLGPQRVNVGDWVEVGDTLAVMKTITLYAPCDGIVGSVGAQPGDEAAYLTQKYGALMYLEPAARMTIAANTRNAYDSVETKDVHVGETVYLRNANDSTKVGTGVVTSVSGNNYAIEVVDEGGLALNNTVSVYRNKDYSSASKLGSGTVSRVANLAISGEGTVVRLLAKQGETVRRGDPLIEMCSDIGLPKDALSEVVTAERAGYIVSVDAAAGASVKNGQALVTVAPLDALAVNIDMPESYLRSIVAGDAVRVHGSTMEASESVSGKIVGISGVSDAAGTFTVTVGIEAGDWMRVGMSVDVYFN